MLKFRTEVLGIGDPRIGVAVGRVVREGVPTVVAIAVASAIAEYICLHLAWVSAAGGVVLIVSEQWFEGRAIALDLPVLASAGDVLLTLLGNRWVFFVAGGGLALVYWLVLEASVPRPNMRLYRYVAALSGSLVALLAFNDTAWAWTATWAAYVTVPACLVMVPAVFFTAAQFLSHKSSDSLARTLAAWSAMLMLLLLLLASSSGMIIVIVASLQVLANVFLQYASSLSPAPNVQPTGQRPASGKAGP